MHQLSTTKSIFNSEVSQPAQRHMFDGEYTDTRALTPASDLLDDLVSLMQQSHRRRTPYQQRLTHMQFGASCLWLALQTVWAAVTRPFLSFNFPHDHCYDLHKFHAPFNNALARRGYPSQSTILQMRTSFAVCVSEIMQNWSPQYTCCACSCKCAMSCIMLCLVCQRSLSCFG